MEQIQPLSNVCSTRVTPWKSSTLESSTKQIRCSLFQQSLWMASNCVSPEWYSSLHCTYQLMGLLYDTSNFIMISWGESNQKVFFTLMVSIACGYHHVQWLLGMICSFQLDFKGLKSWNTLIVYILSSFRESISCKPSDFLSWPTEASCQLRVALWEPVLIRMVSARSPSFFPKEHLPSMGVARFSQLQIAAVVNEYLSALHRSRAEHEVFCLNLNLE